MDDIVLTPVASSRASAPITWNDGGGGGFQPSLRTRYQEKETLDIDEPDAESLPAAEAAPGGRKRKYTRRARAAPRRGVARGRVGKPRGRRRKGRKKRTGRRRRTKGYTVRKGKIRVYSSALGAPRMFSASKILSKISPSTIENAANLVARSRARGRGRGRRKR